jgi:hypothetical protein
MPRWTQEQLNEYEQRRRNLAGGQASGSVPEQAVRHDSLGPKQRKKADPKRYKVCIVSYRKRLIDPDNLCPKYFIDALRYCGVIQDDTAKHIAVEISQEKVAGSFDVRTEITVIPL